MTKEPYVKPAVKSEILEPEALANPGSSGGYNPAKRSKGDAFSNTSCCEEDVWPFW